MRPDEVDSLKAAIGIAIDRALPKETISGLRIDVKMNREGAVTKVIVWPEVELYVRPQINALRYT